MTTAKKTTAKTQKPAATAQKPAVTAQKPAATAQKPAVEAVETVEAAVAAGKETVETVVKASADAATKGVEKAVAMGQEQVAAAAKAGTEAFKGYEEIISYNKDNLDALVKANAIFVKGFQSLNTELFAMAQGSIEENAALTKKLLACKSLQEAVALQNDAIKSSYTKAVEQSRKITDMSVKVAEEASAPLASRVNVAVEKMTTPIAA